MTIVATMFKKKSSSESSETTVCSMLIMHGLCFDQQNQAIYHNWYNGMIQSHHHLTTTTNFVTRKTLT